MSETRYGYNEDDIAAFASNIENKASYIRDRDFLGKLSLEEELKTLDAEVGDMQNLNLFGVKVNNSRDDPKTLDDKTRKVLKDLVTLAKKMDPMGVTMDFKKRKSFTFYDPYNEEANQEFHSILKWA